MKQLTIISGKGGTGKTSITSSIACLLEEPIIVDADVETENMMILLKPSSTVTNIFTTGKLASINDRCISCGRCIDVCVFDAISEDFVVDPLFCEGCGACIVVCPEDAIDFSHRTIGEYCHSKTSCGDLFHARVYPGEGNSGELVTLLRRLAESEIERSKGEIIIIDGSPGTGCPVIASITGVDLVVIVTEPTLSALSDMKRVIELCRHFNIPVNVIINKHDINTEIAKNIRDFCMDKDIDVIGEIPFDQIFVEGVISGKPIVKLAPKSRPAALLKEITGRIKETLIL